MLIFTLLWQAKIASVEVLFEYIAFSFGAPWGAWLWLTHASVKWKSTLHFHFFSKTWLHSVGDLTDWNESDLRCVIIINLAVAHTSSNYFKQWVLYLNSTLRKSESWKFFPFHFCSSCCVRCRNRHFMQLCLSLTETMAITLADKCSCWIWGQLRTIWGQKAMYWNKKNEQQHPHFEPGLYTLLFPFPICFSVLFCYLLKKKKKKAKIW